MPKYNVLVTDQNGVWYQVEADSKEEAEETYNEGVKVSEELVMSQVEEVRMKRFNPDAIKTGRKKDHAKSSS